MVLGCYYLTLDNPNAIKGKDTYYSNLDDALRAYEQGAIELHAYIWVRFDGEVEGVKGNNELEKEEILRDGSIWKYYNGRKVRETAEGEVIAQYIYTTAGRIIYNKTIMDALA